MLFLHFNNKHANPEPEIYWYSARIRYNATPKYLCTTLGRTLTKKHLMNTSAKNKREIIS